MRYSTVSTSSLKVIPIRERRKKRQEEEESYIDVLVKAYLVLVNSPGEEEQLHEHVRTREEASPGGQVRGQKIERQAGSLLGA